MSKWWSVHTHSRKSKDDALSSVTALVEQAAVLEYPALGLTDHGTVGGVAELYTACKKADIKPGPGIELYLVGDQDAGERSAMHLTVMAYTAVGYRNLVGLNNLAQENWHYRNGRVDFAQIAKLAESGLLGGLAVGTGCRSGPVVKAIVERGPDAGAQIANALAGWFPRVYIELMNHGFAAEGMHDNEICEHLLTVSKVTGLPFIITGDAHYALPSEREAHDALKTLVVHQGVEVDDRKFNGEGYWLLDRSCLEQHFSPGVVDEAIANLADLAEAMDVRIPELDTFTLKIPDVTFKGTQQETLEELAIFGLSRLTQEFSAAKLKKYMQRLDDELAVVATSGFAGYLLLVHAITEYCWSQGIWYYTRGSATGSLILYVLGITQEDPVEWDIRFDRFLSTDRTSPPDVDLDIEHTRRDEVVAHFAERYPVLQVGTTMTYGITAEADEHGEQKGSLAQKYYSLHRQIGDGIASWADIPEHDKEMLKGLADRDLVSGRGAHPGGYILAADQASVAFMPLEFINSSKTMVTAFDKGDVEKMGLPKIDLLGSKVLTALRIACTLIAKESAREYYLEIPMKDKETLKRCADGRTTGLFQLGGYTNRKVCELMDPKKVADLVAVQALARPAPMQSGFTKSFLRRRDKSEVVPVMHDDIAAETKDTYGLAIYQEQLVGVLRRLGLSPERLTKLLKAVKASGKQHAIEAARVMDSELEPLKLLAQGRGWSQIDLDWLTGCLRDYGAGYSFGKAHAVQYGVTGYRTAYLAQHESLAYWTGMLIAYTGAKDAKTKEPLELRYKGAARKDGVKVYPPHVHYSGVEYQPDPENYVIREGLTSVPFVGEEVAKELITHRPYESMVDLAQKVSGKVTGAKDLLFAPDTESTLFNAEGVLRTTVIAQLHKAGALKDIPHGEPMRRAKGRIRRCKECKTTFSTPLEYEDHVEENHEPANA